MGGGGHHGESSKFLCSRSRDHDFNVISNKSKRKRFTCSLVELWDVPAVFPLRHYYSPKIQYNFKASIATRRHKSIFLYAYLTKMYSDTVPLGLALEDLLVKIRYYTSSAVLALVSDHFIGESFVSRKRNIIPLQPRVLCPMCSWRPFRSSLVQGLLSNK